MEELWNTKEREEEKWNRSFPFSIFSFSSFSDFPFSSFLRREKIERPVETEEQFLSRAGGESTLKLVYKPVPLVQVPVKLSARYYCITYHLKKFLPPANVFPALKVLTGTHFPKWTLIVFGTHSAGFPFSKWRINGSGLPLFRVAIGIFVSAEKPISFLGLEEKSPLSHEEELFLSRDFSEEFSAQAREKLNRVWESESRLFYFLWVCSWFEFQIFKFPAKNK